MKKLACITACLLALLLCGCQKTDNESRSEASDASLRETHQEGTIQVNGEDLPLYLSYYPEDGNLRGELKIGENCMNFRNAGPRLGFLDNGFRVADVNRDGYQDVLVDRGFVKENAYSGCYVQQKDGTFLAVQGFEDLALPFWSEKGGFLVVPNQENSSTYVINHYHIQGNQLFLFERLVSDYTSGPLYNIERMENGEMVIVSENLTESNVDLDYWYLG